MRKLPQKIFDKITNLVPHLSLFRFHRELNAIGLTFTIDNKILKASRAWDSIFKDEKWLDMVMNETYDNSDQQPIPVLIGRDVHKLYDGSSGPIYLCLAVNDWGGDIKYNETTLFDSLKPYKRGENANEIQIKDSQITILIEDHSTEEIRMKNPKRLFSISEPRPFEGPQISTAALYYGECTPTEISQEDIGGIIDKDGHLSVNKFSSIRSKLRNGKPIARFLVRLCFL